MLLDSHEVGDILNILLVKILTVSDCEIFWPLLKILILREIGPFHISYHKFLLLQRVKDVQVNINIPLLETLDDILDTPELGLSAKCILPI